MSAQAAYTYDAWLRPTRNAPTGVVDGDTLYCGIDLGLNVAVNQSIRLYGINCPEMNTNEGKQAKLFTVAWFQKHCPDGRFIIHTERDRTEKYGRFLGDVYAADGAHLNSELLAAGMAVPYLP